MGAGGLDRLTERLRRPRGRPGGGQDGRGRVGRGRRQGISLTPLARRASATGLTYSTVEVGYQRQLGAATLKVRAPVGVQPASPDEIEAAGPGWWALAACRELDDAILHLRFNEPELGTWVLATEGDPAAVLGGEATMAEHHRSLADPRGPGLLEAHPQAPRRVRPQPGGPDRSR